MKRLIFAEGTLETVREISSCSELAAVGWPDWRDRSRLHALECLWMRISYVRIAEETKKMTGVRLHYLMADPRENLRRILADWYRRGEAKNAFPFYRALRAAIETTDFRDTESVRRLENWILRQDPRPLINPQLALLDPSRKIEAVQSLLEHEFDRVEKVSGLVVSPAENTPLKSREFLRSGGGLDRLIEGELVLYERFDRPELGNRPQKQKSGELPCGKVYLRGVVKSVTVRRIRGWVLFRELPSDRPEIQLNIDGKEYLRLPLTRSERTQESDAGAVRLSFLIDDLSLRREDKISIRLLPCGKSLRFSPESRRFFHTA